jgi:hypothetical protein
VVSRARLHLSGDVKRDRRRMFDVLFGLTRSGAGTPTSSRQSIDDTGTGERADERRQRRLDVDRVERVEEDAVVFRARVGAGVHHARDRIDRHAVDAQAGVADQRAGATRRVDRVELAVGSVRVGRGGVARVGVRDAIQWLAN